MTKPVSPSGFFGWLAARKHDRAQQEHRAILQGSLATCVAAGDALAAVEQVGQIAELARANAWPGFEVQNLLVQGRIGKGKESHQVLQALVDPSVESSLSQHGKRAVFGAMLHYADLNLYAYDTWIAPIAMKPYVHMRGSSLLHRLAQRYPQDPTGAFEPLEEYLKHEIKKQGAAETLKDLQEYKATMMLGYPLFIDRGYNGSLFEQMTPQGRTRMHDFWAAQGLDVNIKDMKFGEAQATPPAIPARVQASCHM